MKLWSGGVFVLPKQAIECGGDSMFGLAVEQICWSFNGVTSATGVEVCV